MKKLIALALALAVALTACACSSKDMSDSRYCGTWEGSKASYSGAEIPVSSVYKSFSIELSPKGVATLDCDGTKTTGSWEETAKGVSIDGGSVELTADGSNLKLEQDGLMVIFVKQ